MNYLVYKVNLTSTYDYIMEKIYKKKKNFLN
jgi:hypothetical protein